jgi:hypothetical protein
VLSVSAAGLLLARAVTAAWRIVRRIKATRRDEPEGPRLSSQDGMGRLASCPRLGSPRRGVRVAAFGWTVALVIGGVISATAPESDPAPRGGGWRDERSQRAGESRGALIGRTSMPA